MHDWTYTNFDDICTRQCIRLDEKKSNTNVKLTYFLDKNEMCSFEESKFITVGNCYKSFVTSFLQEYNPENDTPESWDLFDFQHNIRMHMCNIFKNENYEHELKFIDLTMLLFFAKYPQYKGTFGKQLDDMCKCTKLTKP